MKKLITRNGKFLLDGIDLGNEIEIKPVRIEIGVANKQTGEFRRDKTTHQMLRVLTFTPPPFTTNPDEIRKYYEEKRMTKEYAAVKYTVLLKGEEVEFTRAVSRISEFSFPLGSIYKIKLTEASIRNHEYFKLEII